uniref:NAD-dependent protein deacetylase n=1 Tax=Strigamia maritima TaxID=126957 RepID=T1IPY0_STRMM
MENMENTGPDSNHSSDEDNDVTFFNDFILVQSLLDLFAKKLGLSTKEDKTPPEKILDEVSFDGIVNYIKNGTCKNIIVLTGAGVSTSAGIPDFRSPGSGLYDNLQKFDLPHPQAIFEISYFKENPQPFFSLAKELYPGSFKPTPCHYFIRLLHEKNMLLRLYTQNIDTLERIALIPEEKIVEAHGTFYTSHCMNRKCGKEYSLPWMQEKIFADEIPKCTECKTVVKPDIVFFGENLPDRFYSCTPKDFKKCDLLIVIGTSLTVQPFASLIEQVPTKTPRLLINKEKAGQTDNLVFAMGFEGGMKFDDADNYRDVAWLGMCDDGCQALADALGWGKELKDLVKREGERLERENKSSTEPIAEAAAKI